MFEKVAWFASGLLCGAVFGGAYYLYKNETKEEWELEKKQRKEAREFVKKVMSA